MIAKRKIIYGVLVALVVVGALLALVLLQNPAPPQLAEPTASPELIKKGEYIARLGDCMACHTVADGKPLAGGLALKTPFGTMYSTNITPDPEHGIGKYSYALFDRVMRHGVAADGHNLYPAMPYPSYARMTPDDMQALYVYLKNGVQPVAQANQQNTVSWPFSMRWGLAAWRNTFADIAPFVANPQKDELSNRGAYLVESLGHCGACHTPRGIGFQEKAMHAQGQHGALFLAGATVEHWRALSLRNLWTVDDTVMLLKTGRNRFATVSGNMVDVVEHSTQHMSDTDLKAIATYLKGLPAGKDDLPMPSVPINETVAVAAAKRPEGLFTTRGGLGYVQFCADCHRLDGLGVNDIFPSLVNNPSLVSNNPDSLIHILLTGSRTAQTAAHPRAFTMPGFSRLEDVELAEIINFMRDSWGNKAAGKPEVITVNAVSQVRAALDPKTTDSSAFVTPRIADVLRQNNAEQLIRGVRLNQETYALLPQHVGNKINCSSCHLNAGTVAEGSPYLGVSAFFPSYQKRAGRVISMADRINGCFRRSMNGKPLPLDSADMNAMLAYFEWMRGKTTAKDKVEGRGVGKIDPALIPNAENGKKIYEQQCAVCHGKDGEGLRRVDGEFIYPPLWGDQSFNIGAGMARTYTAAAFVKRNMPIGTHDKFPLGQGGLSDQEALDVAEYFSHQPRPDFADKAKDWPKDPKPKDARY